MQFVTKEYKKVIITILGSLIGAVGIAWFLTPAMLYSGGITGIAQLITNGLSTYYDKTVNLGFLLFLLNVPIITFGIIKMNRKFVYYSIFSIILQSLLLAFLPEKSFLEDDILANAIVGASLIGIGAGLNLRVGSSLGGVDIVFQYIAFHSNYTVGFLGMALNAIIISIAGFLFSWPIAIYTIIRIIITNLVVDKVHTSYNYIKMEIITEKGKEIATALVNNSKHGVTQVRGTGVYTAKEKDILNTIISAYELNKMIVIIKHIDNEAFISISTVKKVVGNFTKIAIE